MNCKNVGYLEDWYADTQKRRSTRGQTGHGRWQWPLVILKELADNSLDACEESGTGLAPQIGVTVDGEGITVADNGPGIPPEIIDGVLDFGPRLLPGGVRGTGPRRAG